MPHINTVVGSILSLCYVVTCWSHDQQVFAFVNIFLLSTLGQVFVNIFQDFGGSLFFYIYFKTTVEVFLPTTRSARGIVPRTSDFNHWSTCLFYPLTTCFFNHQLFILVILSKTLHHHHQHKCIILLVHAYLCVFRSNLLGTFSKRTHSGWLLVPKYTLELELELPNLLGDDLEAWCHL